MAANDEERATVARLADEVVPTLIERLANSELGELEVRQDGWRVRLRRGPNGEADRHAAPGSAPHKPAAVAHASTPPPPRRERPRGQIKSPAVGYFTLHKGIAVGNKVRSGDVLGSVDVLGVREEVVSPSDGVLKALEVESGQAVEFGQTIGRIEAQAQSNV